MKKVLLTVAVMAAGALAPLPALAQGWSDWDDAPPSAQQRPSPRWYQQDDDRYYEQYERYDERRTRNRRYQQRWQNPDDDWGDGTTYERSDDQRRAPPQYQRDDESGQDEADSGVSQSPRGPDGKPIGENGGARPVIQAVAPEVTSFAAGYAPGSIVIDTGARKLYFVRDTMSAFVYPIGVGRDGFSWSGSEKVSRIADWPDWYPPAEMRKRRPELPERMLGGLNNPLGAKAIYLGNTLYRIHGTNDPKSIGRAESSGCFRMINGHVLHLASLVQVGAEVTVVRSLTGAKVAAAKPPVQTKPKPAQVQRPQNARVQWGPDNGDDDTYYEPDRYRY